MTSGVSRNDWRSRVASASEVISEVKAGDQVFVGSACATPRALVEALERREPPPEDVTLVHSLTDERRLDDVR